LGTAIDYVFKHQFLKDSVIEFPPSMDHYSSSGGDHIYITLKEVMLLFVV